MKAKNKNFLEAIPVKSEKIGWQETEDGLVQLIIYRNGRLDKILRKIFKTPNKMTIDLDEIGSCVWKCIDDSRNIFEISKLLENDLGQKVEPINERLITFIKILKNNNFINLENL